MAQFVNDEPFFANAGTSEGVVKAWETRRNGAAALGQQANAASQDDFKRSESGDTSPLRSKENAAAHRNAETEWKTARAERIAAGDGRKGDSVDTGWKMNQAHHRSMAEGHERMAASRDKAWKEREKWEDRHA